MSRFFKAPEHQKPKFGWDAGQKSFNERVGPERGEGGVADSGTLVGSVFGYFGRVWI